MGKIYKKYKAKKIRTGGVYWVDFSSFTLPEWGNTESNTPHLSILLKSNNFMSKEMYISIPLTTNSFYYDKYGENIVHKIVLEKRVHYALINQIRIIGKKRIKKQLILATGDDIFASTEDLELIWKKLHGYLESKFTLTIRDLRIKENKGGEKCLEVHTEEIQ